MCNGLYSRSAHDFERFVLKMFRNFVLEPRDLNDWIHFMYLSSLNVFSTHFQLVSLEHVEPVASRFERVSALHMRQIFSDTDRTNKVGSNSSQKESEEHRSERVTLSHRYGVQWEVQCINYTSDMILSSRNFCCEHERVWRKWLHIEKRKERETTTITKFKTVLSCSV